MKNPPFDSLVWGSLRLAPIIFSHEGYPEKVVERVYKECVDLEKVVVVLRAEKKSKGTEQLTKRI